MSSTIDNIPIDVLLVERQSEPVETTEHPIEVGAEPTDHIRVKPVRLSLECLITNTPLTQAALESRGTTQLGRSGGYAQRTYAQLRALKRSGRAVVVETPADRWENMQVTDIARSRDSSLGVDSIQFTITFKEIFFVTSGSVQLERVTQTAIPKKPTNTVKQGKQTEESAATHGEFYRGSTAKEITDNGVFGLFREGSITTFGSGFTPRGP